MDDEIEEGMVVDDDVQAVADNDQQRERKPEKSPHELLKETKGSVEEIVAQILSVKRQGLPKAELRELVTQMFVHFVTLRQVNRSILLEEDRVKSETERAKAPVDFATLQLHNLMYEKSHYIKAIKTCKDFKSKYPDIELVPEEEFFRDAPEEIKGSVTANEAHDLMLRRLNFELFQRKELCKLHEQLEQRKKVLEEGIANRKKFLSSLPSHLKSLRKASLPVQNQLGIQHTKKMKQHNLAELLPPPLYVIYSQLMAQREAFEENIELEIVGSLKDAQAFVRQQANKDSGSSNLESSKMEDDAPDDEDDGQRRRKRSKNVPAKENIELSGLYQIHPLKVILHVFDDEASDPKPAKLVTLKFEHMPKLNVVTVGIEGSNEGPQDNILCNLFPDDTGRDLPHQSAKLAIGDSLSFDQRTSRPYKWVQHLAGIDFLPEMSPLLSDHETSSTDITRTDVVSSGLTLYRQQNRVETILQRIRSRKKAQLALMEQLHSLEKLQWPALDCKNVPWAHHRFSCKLHGWSALRSTQDHLSLAPPVDNEQGNGKEIMDAADNESSVNLRDETESAREDGELPSLGHAAVNDTKFTPRGSRLAHTRQLALMAKSISPLTKSKAMSFKKQDDELDILLDLDSDLEEPSPTDQEMEDAAAFQMQRQKSLEKAWFNYGVKEFCLVLTSKVDGGDRILKLEAKIKISMEYPLRPPLFSLSIEYGLSRGNRDSGEDFQWSDKLRAMEAEVNLNMFNILPVEQENKTLAHQVHFLGMMLDYLVDEMSPTSEKSEATSIIDFGLCKPVSGKLLARSVRGRDRRKIIPWKH